MRKKLLLADDSITIQKVVELTFPSDEFEVVTAGNGRLAIEKAKAFFPDMVLCDVIMPQLDGYQVCEALRATPGMENVPILLLNGAFEPYDADRARAVGALGNVSKPFDPPALVARVKEILSERSTASYPRPTQPLIVAEVMAAAEAMTVPAPAVSEPHAYTYDEAETHPVSTVEVPINVRELAARSLSLDAPVFAHEYEMNAGEASTEAASEIDPADLSETLHGPLDGAGLAEPAGFADDGAQEIEPLAMAEVHAAPAPMAAPAAEEAAVEPVEFDSDTAMASEDLPQPKPATAAPVAEASMVEEFSQEHEFEPHELDAAATTSFSGPSVEPQPMSLPEELPAAPADMVPEELAPMSVPSRAVHEAIGLPAPGAAKPPGPPPPAVFQPPVAAVVAPPVPAVPPPVPAVPAVASPTPSAEVPVPVDMVQQIAQRVISQVSERVIREIAWDVIPGLAEKLIRAEIERIKARAESERD